MKNKINKEGRRPHTRPSENWHFYSFVNEDEFFKVYVKILVLYKHFTFKRKHEICNNKVKGTEYR
jgi:hypothetical protein